MYRHNIYTIKERWRRIGPEPERTHSLLDWDRRPQELITSPFKSFDANLYNLHVQGNAIVLINGLGVDRIKAVFSLEFYYVITEEYNIEEVEI